MTLIQIVLLAFFVVAIGKVWGRRKAHDLSIRAAVVWTIFWCVAGVVAVLPNSTATVAKIFGVGRGADVVIYISLAILFFIVFRLTVKIEKLNRDITSAIRDEALRDKK